MSEHQPRVREVIIYPDSVLTKKCEPVTDFNDEVRALLADMERTMLANNGVGLAAPQVGFLLRAVVIKVLNVETKTHEVVSLVNPRIVERRGVQRGKEGCLSTPGFLAENVTRAQHVRVEAQDGFGNPFEIAGDGFLARALQHELDHLEGKMFVDYLSPLKRQMVAARYKKAKGRGMKYRSEVPEPQDFTESAPQ